MREFSDGFDRNLYRILLDRAQTDPDRVYYYSQDGPVSYGQMCRASARLARQLGRNAELVEKPTLAINVDNDDHILYLTWACLAAGVCLAFLPSSRDPAQVRVLMDQIGAAVLATDVPELQAEPWSISCEALARGRAADAELVGDSVVVVALGPDTPAFIFQTSGTTGEARWVQVSHGQFLSAIECMQRAGCLAHAVDQVAYITPPLSHSFGLSSLLEYTSVGSAIVLPRGGSPLGAVGELTNPARAGVVTAIEGVPYFYSQMARLINRVKLPALRHVGLGGGGLDWEVVRRIDSVYPGLSYSVRYGMTETPSVVSHKLFAHPCADDWGSSGRVLPIYDLRIVDQMGRVLAPGQEGEIQIKGACLAWPYYGEEGDEEFFTTGDVGYINADQELCVVGRKSLYLKIRGYRISPEYIESLIGAFDGVLDCRVLMQNSALLAQVVRANDALLERDLKRFLAEKLPGYTIPDRVAFVEAIPRTPSGKIKRH